MVLMRMKQAAVVVLVAGLAALAAGCGGGKKTTTVLQQTSPLTVQNTTTGSSTPSFASAKNCRDLAGLAAKAAAAVSASSGNSANALQTESAELNALAQAAPSDIEGDFQTFAAAFSGFLHTLQSSGYKLSSQTPPTAAQLAALAKAAKAFNTPKLKHAEQHLSAWARQNCKGFGG